MFYFHKPKNVRWNNHKSKANSIKSNEISSYAVSCVFEIGTAKAQIKPRWSAPLCSHPKLHNRLLLDPYFKRLATCRCSLQVPSLVWFVSFFFFFFFVQFNVPFKIISLISRRANRKVGRKREYPGKNHLTHPQVELDLSHLWPVWGSNPNQSQRWDDRMVKGDNEISHLNHSATGAAWFVSDLILIRSYVFSSFGSNTLAWIIKKKQSSTFY